MIRTRRLTAVMLAALVLTSAGCVDQPAFRIDDAWIRAAPPGSEVLAGYLEFRNSGPDSVVITGVTSPDFQRTMMHNTVIEEGVARMRHLGSVTVPAGASVVFEPGGRHLMLMSPNRALGPGTTVKLLFQRDNGEVMEVHAPVRTIRPESAE